MIIFIWWIEVMWCFGCVDCINCDFYIIVSVIFKIYRVGECRGYFMVNLWFSGMCINCVLCDKVCDVLVCDYIKKFGCGS